MTQDMNARWLRWTLTAIAGFLALIALELSVLIGPQLPSANAQIPDSGAQRNDLINAQKATTAKLDAVLQLLRTQTIKVQVVGTDKEDKRTSARKPREAKPARGKATAGADGR